MEFLKRVFSKQRVESVSKSIRCPVMMWTALEKLAEEAGETPNAYIVLVLDQFLQVQVENGKLTLPTDSEDQQTAS